MEGKVEKCKDDFEKISATAKKEIKLFDLTRAKEFKNELTKYLQTLLNNQEQVSIWLNNFFINFFNYILKLTF